MTLVEWKGVGNDVGWQRRIRDNRMMKVMRL